MYTALSLAFSLIIRALNNPNVQAAAKTIAIEASRSIINSARIIGRRQLRMRGFRL